MERTVRDHREGVLKAASFLASSCISFPCFLLPWLNSSTLPCPPHHGRPTPLKLWANRNPLFPCSCLCQAFCCNREKAESHSSVPSGAIWPKDSPPCYSGMPSRHRSHLPFLSDGDHAWKAFWCEDSHTTFSNPTYTPPTKPGFTTIASAPALSLPCFALLWNPWTHNASAAEHPPAQLTQETGPTSAWKDYPQPPCVEVEMKGRGSLRTLQRGGNPSIPRCVWNCKQVPFVSLTFHSFEYALTGHSWWFIRQLCV